MAFCTNCGSPLEEGAKFCGQCGTPTPTVNNPQLAPQ
ncbi:MAG: zinc-ribbon domain-containing protein, partial [Muribaculaceae bacterium]|nr:zinc-ribbon domain-containing protein [Muribaculaceae bacterium]